MRIAMVSEHASPLAVLGGVDAGGQNVHVAALAAALARRGDEVVVHTRRDDPGLPRARRAGARRRRRPRRRRAARADPQGRAAAPHGRVRRASSRSSGAATAPDVVHAHFWMSGLARSMAARGARRPGVQTFHALGRRQAPPPGRRRTRARPSALGDRARHRPPRRPHRRHLHRRGVRARAPGRRPRADHRRPVRRRPRRFRPTAARAAPRRAARLLVVGRLVERKGIGNVDRGAGPLPGAELRRRRRAARGELDADPEARRLRALARELGVADRVELRGRVSRDDLPALLRSADAVVCVPWYEPFGIVPLEAMACGVPVVASAVGGDDRHRSSTA